MCKFQVRQAVSLLERASVEEFVLDEERRFIIGEDGTEEQPFRIAERIGRDNAQTWHPDEVLFRALGVSGTVPAPATHRRAHHHRDADLAVVHPAVLAGVIEKLVESKRQKIPEHDFNDRTHTAKCETRSNACDGGLRYRSGEDTVWEAGRTDPWQP